MTCERRWAIQAIDEGRLSSHDVAAFERHCARCASCREEYRSLQALRGLASELRAPVQRELDLRRLRARILRDAMRGSPPRRPRALLAAVAGAVAVAAAALALARPPVTLPIPSASVMVTVSRPPAGADTLGDSSLRQPSEEELLPATAPPSKHASSRPLSVSTHPSPVAAPSSSGPEEAARSDAEMADYLRAVDAYRLGRFAESADLLRRFVSTYPTSTVLDDAWFIEAASLASAGAAGEAADVAEAHLARFPDSFHRKQAAILVARSRRDRGDCEGAKAVLSPWASDTATLSELGRCHP